MISLEPFDPLDQSQGVVFSQAFSTSRFYVILSTVFHDFKPIG